MRVKLLHEVEGKRMFAVVLETGDEVMTCVETFATSQKVGAAQISAIGAMNGAELAFFDWETKEYLPIAVNEQVEVASLIGDIALDPNGKPAIHLHAVLGRKDGTTCAVMITETPAHLHKAIDPESGLALIAL